MQALSLWQPWAQLIVTGHKRRETRSWPPPGARIGQRIAIHAAKRKPTVDDFNHAERSMLMTALGIGWRMRIPYGAIVCTAYLDGAERVLDDQSNAPHLDRINPSYERTFGDYSVGRWMWALADIRPLPAPIPYKGSQRLFEIEGPAAEQLARFEAEWETA